jgi:hypothetical protein
MALADPARVGSADGAEGDGPFDQQALEPDQRLAPAFVQVDAEVGGLPDELRGVERCFT